ncbi:hypothetical protein I3842_15G050700 [Carya illinoinensis]|uniref:DCL protein n=1 Tax=Carya illinoinensis TaxID=32201 RepID=A0A922A9J4_CARIL|nr:hypothetical protein I3842_15G050700 [Carya illinoinensis]
MAAPLLLRGIAYLRLRLHHQHQDQHRISGSLFPIPRRLWCTAAAPTRSDKNLSPTDSATADWSAGDLPKNPRCEDTDYRKWKVEILRDIEPITYLAKDILHSDRYIDGELLTGKDKKAVLDKLLAYHPHSEDKIGCGLDSIMVDRHPTFKSSRCLFVIRTDGGWIDFSYLKCLQAYIRDKYPSHAERFIREHFKRGSG